MLRFCLYISTETTIFAGTLYESIIEDYSCGPFIHVRYAFKWLSLLVASISQNNGRPKNEYSYQLVPKYQYDTQLFLQFLHLIRSNYTLIFIRIFKVL